MVITCLGRFATYMARFWKRPSLSTWNVFASATQMDSWLDSMFWETSIAFVTSISGSDSWRRLKAYTYSDSPTGCKVRVSVIVSRKGRVRVSVSCDPTHRLAYKILCLLLTRFPKAWMSLWLVQSSAPQLVVGLNLASPADFVSMGEQALAGQGTSGYPFCPACGSDWKAYCPQCRVDDAAYQMEVECERKTGGSSDRPAGAGEIGTDE
jgi:hypothetical protein